MTLDAFSQYTKLSQKQEIEKVKLLAFYHFKQYKRNDFNTDDIKDWFFGLGYAIPNISRLKSKILSSRDFIKSVQKGKYRISAIALDEMQSLYPGTTPDTEEIISDETILPSILTSGTRGFIENLSKQINASYEYNIFDGCAVLMRRLLEILLILSYEHLGIDSCIRNAKGNYNNLSAIIDNAKGNSTLKLSRDTKEMLEDFRTLGNFSAHKIYYTSRRTDIKSVSIKYRSTIEELLYKCGIHT